MLTHPSLQGLTLAILHAEGDDDSSGQDHWAAEVRAEGLPGGDVLIIPPHWHTRHGERMTVHEGRVAATVDGVTRVLRAGDAPMVIPPYAVHALRGFPGERLVLREVANPPGPYKAE